MGRLGITLGDPGGVGPEVALKAILSTEIFKTQELFIFGARSLSLQPELASSATRCLELGCTWIKTATDSFERGVSSILNGQSAYEAIDLACSWAKQGRLDAVVTAPIHKTSMQLAQCPAFDHTTLLKLLTGVSAVRMAFYSPTLNTVLHSVHIPLSQVPSRLTQDSLLDTFRFTDGFCRLLGLASPRLALAGLNPHAGENGLMGWEETAILQPALDTWHAHKKYPKIKGPFPPDTLYRRAHLGEFDIVISLYHDQGLIPIKLLHFDEAVNVTLGLPFIRTSPDHGTAFDIAYQNKASASSMAAAIRLAARLIRS